MEDLIRKSKIYNYIKAQINPFGKPFEGDVYEFGIKLMEYIEQMDAEESVTDTNVGGKWIPCSERLPEEGESVQVTFIGYNDRLPHCDKFAYFHDKKWFWCYDHEKVIVKIVAWEPNCEPYKGALS